MKGLELAELLFTSQVKPLLKKQYPELPITACLLGPGSEVLGYDDDMSKDHDWGPRLQLLLPEEHIELRAEIHDFLAENLSSHTAGFPNNWRKMETDNSSSSPQETTDERINHKVEIFTLDELLTKIFGHSSRSWTREDWLLASEQLLLSFTGGKVFQDDTGELTAMREQLSYYPDDIWAFCIYAELRGLGEAGAFIARTRMVGDNLGNRVLMALQVERVMNLAFMAEKRYKPYRKWFGTAFNQLQLSSVLNPHLSKAMDSDTWEIREEALIQAQLILAQALEKAGVLQPGTRRGKFFSRPIDFVFFAQREDSLYDDMGRHLEVNPYPTGSVNQIARDGTFISYAAFIRSVFKFDHLIKE